MRWECQVRYDTRERDEQGRPLMATCGQPGSLHRLPGAFADIGMCEEHAERWHARRLEIQPVKTMADSLTKE